LVGKFVDDEVEIVTPSGKMTYEIIEVKHIWCMLITGQIRQSKRVTEQERYTSSKKFSRKQNL
jgi:hypothetical protein